MNASLVVAVLAFVLIDVLVLLLGADSRPTAGDAPEPWFGTPYDAGPGLPG